MKRPDSASPRNFRTARFVSSFGQRSLLTVDTEEEFDWSGPFSRTGYGVRHVGQICKFQDFCESIGVTPVYLVDWPIATLPLAIETIGAAVNAGKAEIGIQLHPWVNPPHDEQPGPHNSYAGNLPAELEDQKFTRLRDLIEQNFGVPPLIYRAGRYGLGPNSAAMLRRSGIAIDSSVRSTFDYSDGQGPNYSQYPVVPFWLDEPRGVLELPLTTVFWGMLRKQGRFLYPRLRKHPLVLGVLARLALLERIPLTPEGVTVDEARRGIDIALDDGLPLLVLSFHSPSLAPGNTPYVRNQHDVDCLYDWWRRVYAYLEKRGVVPTTIREIIDSVEN
ncbi:WalW protein [Altererythrobacter confluentis]|uniref:WalW protein n=1 Tax=Allopontixanthobacter confluentis TaxID=1849021 RepID=A0A6L7GCJ2_9SPHN|nr:polysaccharide deacetylase family protein [Allopontixanthobacter confluentis]MXP13762.1 WalW protein [Allopontixanthobacter confluentis]